VHITPIELKTAWQTSSTYKKILAPFKESLRKLEQLLRKPQ